MSVTGDIRVSEFADQMIRHGCRVEMDEKRRIMHIALHGVTQAISYELIESAPLDMLVTEVLNQMESKRVKGVRDIMTNAVDKYTKTMIPHKPPKDYSTAGYLYSTGGVTKDEIQQMLDAMRKEMTAEIIQQVCDEIAKLEDR